MSNAAEGVRLVLHLAERDLRREQGVAREPRQARLYLLAPVALILIPAIFEFGSLISATIALNGVAGEAAEVAVLGGTPSRIEVAVTTSDSRIDTRGVSTLFWRRSPDEAQGDSSAWQILGDAGAVNDAMVGDQIRVQLTYSHRLLLGGLSAPFLGATEDGTVELRATTEGVRR